MHDTIQKRVDVTPIIMRLAELLPACIFVYEKRRRPLARGIREQIIAKVGNAITPEELVAALGAYVRSTGYLQAMVRPNAIRIGIDGQAIEAVAPEHAAGAAKTLAARWERRAAAVMEKVEPAVEQGPKRLSLSDLKAAFAARARKQEAV